MDNSQASSTNVPDEKPVPSTRNSISHDINKINQPEILKIFEEELAADNTIKFSGKFSAREEISLTSSLKLENKQGPFFTPTDEFSIIFKPKNAWHSHKLSIKGNKLGLHSDLGKYLMKMSFCGSNFDSWVNPYLAVDTNRNLSKPFLSIGAFSSTPGLGFKNQKITFYQDGHSVEADLLTNSLTIWGKIFLSTRFAGSLFTPLWTNEQEILFGGRFGKAVLALKVERNSPCSIFSLSMDNYRLMFAFATSPKHTLGAEFFKQILLKKPPHFFFAYQFNNNENLRFKCRIDHIFNAQFFAEYLFFHALRVQIAAKTNLVSLKNKGLLDSPPSIGLKFSLNR